MNLLYYLFSQKDEVNLAEVYRKPVGERDLLLAFSVFEAEQKSRG